MPVAWPSSDPPFGQAHADPRAQRDAPSDVRVADARAGIAAGRRPGPVERLEVAQERRAARSSGRSRSPLRARARSRCRPAARSRRSDTLRPTPMIAAEPSGVSTRSSRMPAILRPSTRTSLGHLSPDSTPHSCTVASTARPTSSGSHTQRAAGHGVGPQQHRHDRRPSRPATPTPGRAGRGPRSAGRSCGPSPPVRRRAPPPRHRRSCCRSPASRRCRSRTGRARSAPCAAQRRRAADGPGRCKA